MSKEGNPSALASSNQNIECDVVSKDPLDPYAHISDEQRMEMFAETGNTAYLNPELAKRLHLGTELMKEVLGTGEEDLVVGRKNDKKHYKNVQQHLEKFGLSDGQLKKILEQGDQQYVRYLMDIASMPVPTEDNLEQDYTRHAVDRARYLIKEYVGDNEDGVKNMFSLVRTESSKGVKDVQVIKGVYEEIRDWYFSLVDEYMLGKEMSLEEKNKLEKHFRILEHFSHEQEEYFENLWMPSEMNLLSCYYLLDFCGTSKYTRPKPMIENENTTPFSVRSGDLKKMAREIELERIADFDRDELLPFEIEKGKIAVFGLGKTALYIADKEYTEEHLPIIEKLKSEIRYSLKGHSIAQRVVANVPYELKEEAWNLMDNGDQLGVYPYAGVFNDSEQLRDYMFLMQADVRKIIEERFYHLSLKDLPIKEQIYFSTFLQDMTLGEIFSMQNFISKYGVLGMRTFLSLERGEKELGNLIIEFGVNHPKLANKVYTYYSDLLDSADKAEELAENISHCKLDRCRDAKKKIRENLLNRAQKDLERALKANDVIKIENLVKTYDIHAKEYVALLQEVGTGNIEQVASHELKEEDKERMLALLTSNFDEAYKDPNDTDFKEVVKGSLVNSFTNQNTVFRFLRDHENIVSFNRFDLLRDHKGKEVTYFGSFNADPAYSGVGAVVLEKTIQERLRDGKPMMAHCDPTQPISKKYIESGFIATGYYPLKGKPSFEIWRAEDIQSRFASKNETLEDLVSGLEKGNTSYEIRKQNKQETYPELEVGKVLTRYFVHKGETYLVFEEASGDLKEIFTEPNV